MYLRRMQPDAIKSSHWNAQSTGWARARAKSSRPRNVHSTRRHYGKCSACQSASRSGLILPSMTNTPGAPSATQALTGSRSASVRTVHAARAVAAGYRGEIRFGKLHDVDRKTLAAEIMHLGGIGSIVVDEDAHAQARAGWQFPDRRSTSRSRRRRCRARRACPDWRWRARWPTASRARPIGTSGSGKKRARSARADSAAPSRRNGRSRDATTRSAGRIASTALLKRPRIDEACARFVRLRIMMIVAGADALAHRVACRRAGRFARRAVRAPPAAASAVACASPCTACWTGI